MILQNKSILAATTALLMIVSLNADSYRYQKQHQESMKLMSMLKPVEQSDGSIKFELRTKLDKTKAVASRGFYATVIGVAANIFARLCLEKHDKSASLVVGSLANLILNFDVLQAINRSPKNGEAWATVGAVFAGECVGHFGLNAAAPH